MKVLLQKDIAHLGSAGDVKEVKEGYARNLLIPQSFAVPATPAALQRRSLEHAHQQRTQAAAHKEAEGLAGKLRRCALEMKEKATPDGKLYGGIHRESIVQALRGLGIIIETQSIILKEPIKAVGSHQVEIHLKFGVKSHVQVQVRGES
jgi:large subunit ribosomal protein L9